MKKPLFLTLTTLVLSSSGGWAESAPTLPMSFPADVQPTCVPDNFDAWFSSKTVTKNGAVVNANSANASSFKTRCDFYKWGSQMFLWLTSPSSVAGTTSYVFDKPGFYDVSPADANGNRNFLSNAPGSLNSFALRVVKPKSGSGSTADTEEGQAGGGDVLISQKKSVVYYGLHANDTFAYYLSAYKGQPSGVHLWGPDFPDQLIQVKALNAAAILEKQPPIKAPSALAMELKTSWVDASDWSASDQSQYITIQAKTPVYDRSNPSSWPETGVSSKPKTLALVGMHIVGTVAGHPEMVWTTIEHVNNAPDKPYSYLKKDSDDVAVQTFTASPQNGQWVFTATPASDANSVAPNAEYKGAVADDPTATPPVAASPAQIAAKVSGTPIGPVDVVRLNPWGNAPDYVDPQVASSNSDLVSLNQWIMSKLTSVGDVRANYVQVGGVWTNDGQVPTTGSESYLRGGLRLANSTMETFHQYPDENNGFTPNNCFFCHNEASSHTPSGKNPSHCTSHIFGQSIALWGNKSGDNFCP